MARLPIPGSDDGRWGDVLNSFLMMSLEPDGTLKGGISQSKVTGLTAELSNKVSQSVFNDFVNSNSKRVVQIQATDPNGSDITASNGQAYFTVPSELNNMRLVEADASVVTVSGVGPLTVQVNNTKGSQDILSNPITIEANENTSYTAAVSSEINASYSSVSTGDILRIDVDAAGSGAKGLTVILSFQAI